MIPEHSIISSKRDIEEKTAPFGGRKKGLFVAGKKALFVFNPFSGKGWIKHNLFEVIDLLVKQGYEVEVRPTQKRLDAYEVILNKAPKIQLLVVSGGDGTLNESVKALMELPIEKRPEVGYIPAGSTNDFAASIKIPKRMAAAIGAAVGGEAMACDVGRFNDSFFTYIAAFGAFTDVSYATPQEFKNVLGHTAYLLEGIKRVANLRTYHMVMEHDGETVEGNFIYGMVSNSTFVGGMRTYADTRVKLDDGYFECLFVRQPENPVELQEIAAGLLMHDFSGRAFCVFQTKALFLTFEEAVDWTLDGEYGGAHTFVEIDNQQKAIRIRR